MKTSKIARLPHDLREQLNRRLLDHEAAETLLPWLNDQPATREILARHFPGQPITPQNLSQWRQGGFAVWQIRHELTDSLVALALTAGELQTIGARELINNLTTVLAAHYAGFLNRWDGEATPDSCRRLRLLHSLLRAFTQLRKEAPQSAAAQPGASASSPHPHPAPDPGEPAIQGNPVKPKPSLPPLPVPSVPSAPAESRAIPGNPAFDPEPPADLALLPAILGLFPAGSPANPLKLANIPVPLGGS